MTVLAYEQLVAEGYIRGENRRGFFVNELEPNFSQRGEGGKEKEVTPIMKESIINFKV